MVYTWQEAIQKDLHNPDLPENRVFQYLLPRQVGATTFLRDVAFQEAENGKKVYVLSWGDRPQFLHYYNHPNIRGQASKAKLTLWHLRESHNLSNNLRSLRPDILIVDGIPADEKEPVELSLNYLAQFATKVLYIYTTEGR